MLVFAENFDSIAMETCMHEPVGFGSLTNASFPLVSPGGVYGYFIPKLFVPGQVDIDPSLWDVNPNWFLSQVLPGIGINGTHAMLLGREATERTQFHMVLQTPTFTMDTRRIVFGFWVGPAHPSLGYAGWRLADHERIGAGYGERNFHFDITSPLRIASANTIQSLSSSSIHGIPHFRISFLRYNSTLCKIKLETFRNYVLGSGFYPSIPESSNIYLDANSPCFFEFVIDGSDSVNKNGWVKVAINGEVVHEAENIYVLDHQAFGSDLSHRDSYIGNVRIVPEFQPYYYELQPQIDSFYVCDGRGGYHDNLFGPTIITDAKIRSEGDSSQWVEMYEGQEASNKAVEILGRDHFGHFDSHLGSYVRGDMSGSHMQFFHEHSQFDRLYTNIKAIQYRGVFKKPFSLFEDVLPHVSPFIQTSGGIRGHIHGSMVSFPVDEKFKIMYNPMGVVPGVAVPWTWPLLEETQFGFTYYEGELLDASSLSSVYDVSSNLKDFGGGASGGAGLLLTEEPFGAEDYYYFSAAGYIVFALPSGVLNDVLIYGSNNWDYTGRVVYNIHGSGGVQVSENGNLFFTIPYDACFEEDTGNVDHAGKIIWRLKVPSTYDIRVKYIKLNVTNSYGTSYRYFKVQPRMSQRAET